MATKTGQNAIKYSIITAFSKKGITAAEKGLKNLRESFKKTSLANKLTFAAIGAGLTALAAKAMAAAKEQDKLNKQLSFTLKNLGYTTAIPSVNRFIDTLERQSAVADETLIPAFNSLVRVTTQLTDAYDALQLALDISAITGDDVATIADAMAKGFAGNATALSKLIPGLDRAAIKAGDMKKIMQQLNAEFGGAAQNNLDSFAGKMSIFKISLNKALQNIGQGLLDFLQAFTKTNSIQDLGKAIEDFGTKVADILRGLPTFFKTAFSAIEENLKKSWIGRFILNWFKTQVKILEDAADAAARYGYYVREMRAGGFGPRLWEIKNTKTWSKTVVDTIKTVQKVNFKSKLADMFDLEKAALAVAKRNGMLSKEEQTRVEALQALKTEQESDDELYYKKLLGLSADATAKLIADQNAVGANLKTQLAAQLAAYQAMYDEMVAKARYVTSEIGGRAVTAPRDFGIPGVPAVTVPVAPQIPVPVVPSPGYETQVPTMVPQSNYGIGSNNPINITVNAGAVGSEEYLVGVIGEALTKYTRYGNTTAPAGFI